MKDKTDKPEEKVQETVADSNVDGPKDEIKKECSCGENAECKSCEDKSKLVEEYKSKYLRAIADYQNFERRIQDQRVEWTKNANKNLILKLLTFLDDLERAELFVTDKNLSHVKESFYKMLKSEGLEEIELIGTQYDPYVAEVITMQEGKEDGIIVAILRKGYKYNGQILRVAQVTVSKKSI